MSLEKYNTKTQRYQDTKSEDEISHQIIGASIEVHRILGGPGLLESIYEAALCHELILRGPTKTCSSCLQRSGNKRAFIY